MYGESKVIRLLLIIHNGIILDLVCGFGGSVFRGCFLTDFFFVGARNPFIISASVRVRSGDSVRPFSRGNCVPFGEMRVDRTWIPPRCLHLGRNVGGFIGHSRGVDKIDEVFMCQSGVGVSPDFLPLHCERGPSFRSQPGFVPRDLPVSAEGDAAFFPQESDRRGCLPAGVWPE